MKLMHQENANKSFYRRTLLVFLQDGVDGKFLRQNRILALEHLRGLSETAGPALQETCVLAWGQIAAYVANFLEVWLG